MAAPRTVPERPDAEGGAKLAATNALRLLDASGRLGESGTFGPAVSLAVLAGEEAIKAIGLIAWSSKLPIPTEKQLSLVLRQHEPRHLVAGMLVGAGEMAVALVAGIVAAMAKRPEDASAEDRWSRAAWWSDADNLKNRGLYVEFNGGKWQTPAGVTKAEYERAHQMAGAFVNFVRDIVEEEDPAVRRELVLEAPEAAANAMTSQDRAPRSRKPT